MKYLIMGLIIALLSTWGYMYWDYKSNFLPALQEAAYWKGANFKPDTIRTETRYSETIRELERERGKQDTVSPKQTIIYQSELPVGYLDFQNKVLSYMDSTKGIREVIQTQYITLHPKADKLITGKFRQDSVNLVLLGTNGLIRQDKFPVDYSKFNYDYYDNSMHASVNKTSNTQNKQKKSLLQYNGTNIEYKHDFLQSNHQIEINSGISIWRLRVGGYAQYPLQNNTLYPQRLEGGVKVGARLF